MCVVFEWLLQLNGENSVWHLILNKYSVSESIDQH